MGAVILIAILAFVSTNLDDLLLLVLFFSRSSYRAAHIVLGQYVGIGFLVVTSYICSLAKFLIPLPYIGILGLFPIYIGISSLLKQRTTLTDSSETRNGVLSIASITIANGGDNLGTYIPLFALNSGSDIILTSLVFAVMTGLWCGGAYFLSRGKYLTAYIQKWGSTLLPLVLIGLGAYIIWHAGTLHLIPRLG